MSPERNLPKQQPQGENQRHQKNQTERENEKRLMGLVKDNIELNNEDNLWLKQWHRQRDIEWFRLEKMVEDKVKLSKGQIKFKRFMSSKEKKDQEKQLQLEEQVMGGAEKSGWLRWRQGHLLWRQEYLNNKVQNRVKLTETESYLLEQGQKSMERERELQKLEKRRNEENKKNEQQKLKDRQQELLDQLGEQVSNQPADGSYYYGRDLPQPYGNSYLEYNNPPTWQQEQYPGSSTFYQPPVPQNKFMPYKQIQQPVVLDGNLQPLYPSQKTNPHAQQSGQGSNIIFDKYGSTDPDGLWRPY